MKIRRFEKGDAPELSRLISATLRTSNAADYPADIIEALCEKFSPEWLLEYSAIDHFYVAEEDGMIVGCGAAGPKGKKPGESGLYTIFVHPEYQGRGIGRAIVETLERDDFFLRANRVEIAASITGIEFYRKLGYAYKDGVKELDGDLLCHLEKFRTDGKSIEIKKAETDEEIQGKAYVHFKSWHESYAGIVGDEYLENKVTYENCLSIARKFPDNTLVAKIDGRVVGFASCGADEEVPGAGALYALYVLEEYQKKKIGLSLMRRAAEDLGGFDKITLWVFKDNRKAIDFYEKYGFRQDGAERELNFGKPAVAIRMVFDRT